LIKPLPFNVSENEPGAIVLGLTDVSTGTGFSSVTPLFPIFVLSAALVAVTVIVFGVGRFIGAVYNPVASIVPVVAFPPGTALIDQTMLVFAFPVTAAANVCVAPARTAAVAGVTVTTTPVFSGGIVGDEPPLLLPTPAQPATSKTNITAAAIQRCFTDLSPIVDSLFEARASKTRQCRVPIRVDGQKLHLNWY
jgi:hypothetical protein